MAGVAGVVSSFVTSYTAPALTAQTPVVAMATAGATLVSFTGTNFGAGQSLVTVTYSSSSTGLQLAAACTVTTPHTGIQCTAVAGHGSGCVPAYVHPYA